MPVSVAIIGSGPAGFYAAEALVNSVVDLSIDFIERLPTPFGLIRGGVAPGRRGVGGRNSPQKDSKHARASLKTRVGEFPYGEPKPDF